MRSRQRTIKRKTKLAERKPQPKPRHRKAQAADPVPRLETSPAGPEAPPPPAPGPDRPNGGLPRTKPCPTAAPAAAAWADGMATPIAPKPRKPRAEATATRDHTLPRGVSADEVPRLELADDALPMHARRSRDVAIEKIRRPPAEDRRLEETWQGKASHHAWKWWAWAGLATGVLVAGSVAAVLALNSARRSSAPTSILQTLGVEKIELDESYDLMQEDPIPLQEEAVKLLRQYAAANTPQQVLAVVRHRAAVADRLSTQWRPWPSGLETDRPGTLQFAYTESIKPPLLVVFGKRQDQSPFRVYLAREQGQLKLDWEASEGVCDIPIDRLPEAGLVHDAMVRCEVEAKPLHTAAYPETRFRSFLLSTADRQNWVWGYAERDGEVDRRLAGLLDVDGTILEPKTRERATLRLSASPDRDLPNQFQITEMLHIDWVTP